MKKNLLMLSSLAAVAIGAGDIVNSLQAGSTTPPFAVACVILGIVGFAGNALRGHTKPAND
jgi:hypothetical protein